MNKFKISLVLFLLITGFASLSSAQTNQLLKRTTYKSEKISFGAGGTVTIVGAPNGTIVVEGWSKNEIEVSAEVEMQAETEADLAQLAQVNGFILDESLGHVRVLSVGTHDTAYMKRVAKKFPKKLLNSPFRINYTIKVPNFCDLEINSGRGDLTLANVEGAMVINALEGNGSLNLIGGTINATFGKGDVDVKINTRSWRGRHVDIQLAAGNLNVQFPQNMSAEVDASVLRTGRIENSIASLKQRERAKFTEKSMLARAGNGGAQLSFTVGDGTLKMQNY